MNEDYYRIEKVIRYLEKNYAEQPSLEELATISGLSEYHFHRMFKRWAGITPKDFLKFITAHHAKLLLQESKDLLSTSLETGLSGPGRLHDLMITVEAVTPGEFKTKGQGVEIRYGFHTSPFGNFMIGLTKRGVCFLSFYESKNEALSSLTAKWINATFIHDQDVTKSVAENMFNPNIQQSISVLMMGTPFQLKVWEALLSIPEGFIASYTDLAKLVGSPKAARAVGTAMADNTIAFLIPCHRVIKETGLFGQYRWNPDRKKAILVWENAKRLKNRD